MKKSEIKFTVMLDGNKMLEKFDWSHLMHALRHSRYGSIPQHERMYPVLSLSKHQGEQLGTK